MALLKETLEYLMEPTPSSEWRTAAASAKDIVRDALRVSDCCGAADVMAYLHWLNSHDKTCNPLPFMVAGQQRGLLFAHHDLLDLATLNFIPRLHGVFTPTTPPIRSTLVIAEKDLNEIEPCLAPAPDWIEIGIMSEVLDGLRHRMLGLPSERDDNAMAALFREWAMHVLTKDWKAEFLWSNIADSLGTLTPLTAILPVTDKVGNRDGGIDDLRRGVDGLLATQVKGGEVHHPTDNPFKTLYKFFVQGKKDEGRWKKAARDERLRLWPSLGKPVEIINHYGDVQTVDCADDALVVHYLAVGKRPITVCDVHRGKSMPWPDGTVHTGERLLYVTGLDVIVLRAPRCKGKARVDVSLSGHPLVARMEQDGIIAADHLDAE